MMHDLDPQKLSQRPPHPHSCATLPSIFATNTTVDSRARKRPCSSTPTAFVSCSAAAAGSASGALRSMSTIRLPLSVVKGIRLSLAPGSPAGALPFRIRALQPASGGSAAIRRTVRCAKVGVISTGIGYEVPTLSQSLDSSTHTTIFFAASCTSFSRRSAPLPPLTTLRSRSTASADPIARSIEAVLSALRQGMPSRCSSASVLSEVGTALMPDSSPLLIRSASRSSTKPTVEPVPTPSTMPDVTSVSTACQPAAAASLERWCDRRGAASACCLARGAGAALGSPSPASTPKMSGGSSAASGYEDCAPRRCTEMDATWTAPGSASASGLPHEAIR
mmetsp:Transcript_9307/g.27541  ORF Transcript_9307/g.27541 Transcript_9307/m.27541 type:complete len:335 (+) Transcript_9307:96-1100(+)